ncbi:MAG TPA: type II toxin-antitoxin system HicB family antitoxin [Solirubrobacterales bacterium]|nr:type II toxin-antitoxin system HicB family antitoxin [Solirubrobacterales bacterium]
MAVGLQQAGIPLSLLKRCRAVISRMTDEAGQAVWVAEIPDLPSCRATGSSRVEALDRVREMAERRSGDGGIRRGPSARGAQPSGAAPRLA